VVILEISLPQLNGLDAAEHIKHKSPLLKLVFLTATSDVNAVAEAFRRGASAYVLKQSGTEELLAAIKTIRRGKSYLSSQIARETIEYLLWQPNCAASAKRLTRRQIEILQLLAKGRSMKQVAAILQITPGAVAFHKYNMMGRLGIETNAGLFQYAMRNHMAPAQAV
jgi:DNA-binding NarL/FixJ family response regulator